MLYSYFQRFPFIFASWEARFIVNERKQAISSTT